MKNALHKPSEGRRRASLMAQAICRSALAVLAVALSLGAASSAGGQQPMEAPGGHGKDRTAPIALARAVRAVLDRITNLRRAKGLTAGERSVESTLDGGTLSRVLGHSGKYSAGSTRSSSAGRTSTCATWA